MKITVTGGELDREEIDGYIEYVGRKYIGRQISGIDISIDGDFADLQVHFGDMNFQRAYRSADYLVNNMEKLNNAKQKEFSEKERHKVEVNK